MKTFAVSILSLMDAAEHSIFFIEAEKDTEAGKVALQLFTKPEYREEQQEWVDGLPDTLEEFRCEVFNTDICINIREVEMLGMVIVVDK